MLVLINQAKKLPAKTPRNLINDCAITRVLVFNVTENFTHPEHSTLMSGDAARDFESPARSPTFYYFTLRFWFAEQKRAKVSTRVSRVRSQSRSVTPMHRQKLVISKNLPGVQLLILCEVET